MHSKHFLVLIMMIALGPFLMAQEVPQGFGGFAQYGVGVGAQALGMGSAFTAIAGGPEAVYWNPAALSEVGAIQAGGMYTAPFAQAVEGGGYSVQYVGLAAPVDGLGLGAGWFNVRVEDIPITDGDTFDYDASVFIGGAAISEDLEDIGRLYVGATAKLYREQMLNGSAQGLGWDLGALLVMDNFRLGYCSQDVQGTRYRWQGTGQEPLVEIPWVHRIGLAVTWLEGTVLTAADVLLGLGDRPAFRLGATWAPVEAFALRGGVRLEPQPGESSYRPIWTAGLGVTWESLQLDVAYIRSPIATFGEGTLTTDTYVFSLVVSF